jgi:chromosome segregation ATPase
VSSSLQSELLIVLVLVFTALFTGRDRAAKQRFEQQDKQVSDQTKDIADIRRDLAEERRARDDDRKRFESEMAKLNARIDSKDTTIADLREKVARLRIGIINLGGDPDAVLEDNPAHPGHRSTDE